MDGGASRPHIILMASISTPCLRVCLLDASSGLCEGCGRTVDEIARWGLMTESERGAIMITLAARMRRIFVGQAHPVQDGAS